MPDQLLTRIELAVITLARGEPASSLVRRRGLVRRIFGNSAPQPLASPRLEALRLYAILRRVHRAALPEVEHVRLSEAGFDDPQIREIDVQICAAGRPWAASRKRGHVL